MISSLIIARNIIHNSLPDPHNSMRMLKRIDSIANNRRDQIHNPLLLICSSRTTLINHSAHDEGIRPFNTQNTANNGRSAFANHILPITNHRLSRTLILNSHNYTITSRTSPLNRRNLTRLKQRFQFDIQNRPASSNSLCSRPNRRLHLFRTSRTATSRRRQHKRFHRFRHYNQHRMVGLLGPESYQRIQLNTNNSRVQLHTRQSSVRRRNSHIYRHYDTQRSIGPMNDNSINMLNLTRRPGRVVLLLSRHTRVSRPDETKNT